MMAETKKKNPVKELSFEDAIGQLTSIVSKIESGQVPLQDSLEQYEQGMALIKHCRQILAKAEKQIEKMGELEKTE